jgi:transglutaminase-like putative cysteine protease
VGVCVLPFAGALDAERPWWDYRSWNWFTGGKAVAFDWTHSYGPLDWPREGTTLLNVKSARPHYWKAQTLDRFDGFRWVRSHANERTPAELELPDRPPRLGRPWRYHQYNPEWDVRLRVTVRSLTTDFVVGAGTTYAVRGVGNVAGSADGTTRALEEPLDKGDAYTVDAYAPHPTARQMRGAPRGYGPALSQYTEILLPRRGETAFGVPGGPSRSADRAVPRVVMPLRGAPLTGHRDAAPRLLASPYARVYELARRVTEGAPTAYDAATRLERHLQRYRYAEDPPQRPFPLAAFLFRDRFGYCQQFSGAMALMLRMVGIPSRVASGFSPGSLNRSTGEFRVRDLDAHSWVEVYFTGIGWVPFDPTPPIAPAGSQSADAAAMSAAGTDAGDTRGRASGGADTGAEDEAPAPGSEPEGGLPLWALPLALIALAAVAALAITVAGMLRRRAGRSPGQAVEAHLRELEAALRRLGWTVPRGTTLLALEGRLARIAGPAAARYAARLRAHRYDPRSPGLPGPRARRLLRRELTAGNGLRTRLRGLLAIPPGGPRPL